MISISSTYIIMMHTPTSFSLNSMQGSAGLTWNPKGSCFVVFTDFSRIDWLLGTDHIFLSVIGSSLLMMILDHFLPFQLVISLHLSLHSTRLFPHPSLGCLGFHHHPCKCYPEGNIMCNWSKIVCVVNSWNLTVSQCYYSCTVSTISLDLEHPLISNKSSVDRYLLSICLFPNPLSIILLISFLMATLQLSLSFSIG